MRITWIGHSTVLVELDGVRLLTDPVLRPRVTHLRRVGPVDWDALRDIDAVAVSHAHYDHLDPPSLRRLGRSVPLIVPRGAARMVRGFERVVELEEGEETRVGGLAIRATHAEHSGHRDFLGSPAAAVGFLVSGSSRLYFPGDTDLFPGMSSLAPDLDVAFLPVAGWGSKVPRGHLDPVRAAEALRLAATPGGDPDSLGDVPHDRPQPGPGGSARAGRVICAPGRRARTRGGRPSVARRRSD